MDKLILIGGDKKDTKKFFANHLDAKVVLEQEA